MLCPSQLCRARVFFSIIGFYFTTTQAAAALNFDSGKSFEIYKWRTNLAPGCICVMDKKEPRTTRKTMVFCDLFAPSTHYHPSLSEAKKQIAMIRERKIDSDQLSSSASIERELMWLLWAEKSRYEIEKLLADITAAVVLAHEEQVRISHELGESLQ